MRDDQRQRVALGRAQVGTLDARPVDGSRELRPGVQPRLPGAPVISGPPVLGELTHRLASVRDLTVLVLDVEAAVLADVAEMRGDGLHASATPCHLDHDLRRTADDRRLDP